jgi:diacylglycerol kinase family enzyme
METARGGELFGFLAHLRWGSVACASEDTGRGAARACVDRRISTRPERATLSVVSDLAAPGDQPVIVVNPAASRVADAGRRARLVADVIDAVVARTGRTPLVVDTTLDAARAAVLAARHAPLVVVVGGDGTIREAAAITAGSDVPIGIVPAGTGNVFAAALGIPRRARDAVRLIATGAVDRVDLGRATWGRARELAGPPALSTVSETVSHVFTVACGLGLDARVMTGASPDLKRRYGFAAYVLAASREAARLRSATYRIEADDEVHEVRGLVVLIANCGQIVPWLLGPRRAIDPGDGLLDVFVVTATDLPGGLWGAGRLLLSAAELPERHTASQRFRARRLRVTAEPREPVQVDGDPHDADWLEATIEPGAIRVVRPG